MTGTALLYWKIVEKKTLAEMGITKNVGSYFIGVIISIVLLTVSIVVGIAVDGFMYHGMYKNPDIPMLLLLTGGFMIQGATEEVLCRGIVLHAILYCVLGLNLSGNDKKVAAIFNIQSIGNNGG